MLNERQHKEEEKKRKKPFSCKLYKENGNGVSMCIGTDQVSGQSQSDGSHFKIRFFV